MTETSLDFQELTEADRVVIRGDVQSSAHLGSLRQWQWKKSAALVELPGLVSSWSPLCICPVRWVREEKETYLCLLYLRAVEMAQLEGKGASPILMTRVWTAAPMGWRESIPKRCSLTTTSMLCVHSHVHTCRNITHVHPCNKKDVNMRILLEIMKETSPRPK